MQEIMSSLLLNMECWEGNWGLAGSDWPWLVSLEGGL